MNRRSFLATTGSSLVTISGISGFELQKSDTPYQLAGQPCRNFNILATTSVIDPLDGREKFILSNFAEGETGSIVMIDTLSAEGTNFMLPVGAGAWGLVNWHNKKLIIGTCTEQAYLHVFDLASRTWAEPIKSAGESYFWQMGTGSDDCVYGGTYPGCNLTRFNPHTGEFVNLGRVSPNPKNLYSRPVYCQAPGYVFVWYGFDTTGITVYDIKKGAFSNFGQPADTIREVNDRFVCTENQGKLTFYNATDLSVIEDDKLKESLPEKTVKIQNGQHIGFTRLRNNRIAAVRGQDYFIAELAAAPDPVQVKSEIKIERIPVQATPTSIFTLTTDEQGVVWGSCAFGQTIFSFDPASKKYWNSSSVCNAGGEVYGMVFVQGKLFMSSYVGGDHTVYDPEQPWNQMQNINPKTLAPVAPDLIRPEARSVLGPDRGVWTGWSAKYGTYGGGLSRVDPLTLEVKKWYDPIKNQQLAGLTADKDFLYFTTNGGASGLPYNKVNCHFCVWDTEKGLIHQVQLEEGAVANRAIVTARGLVAMGLGKQIRVFDPQKMTFVRIIELNTTKNCGWLTKLADGQVAAFCGSELVKVDILTGQTKKVCNLPGQVEMATTTQTGAIYFAVRSKLYFIEKI